MPSSPSGIYLKAQKIQKVWKAVSEYRIKGWMADINLVL
jgi:hypothetical protein